MDETVASALEMNTASASRLRQAWLQTHGTHNAVDAENSHNTSHAPCTAAAAAAHEGKECDALCEAMRVHPLALGCGAALGVLGGSSRAAMDLYDTTLHKWASTRTSQKGCDATSAAGAVAPSLPADAQAEQPDNALALPLAASPFHFAATAAFHRQLHALAGASNTKAACDVPMWARPGDVLCHGWLPPRVQNRKGKMRGRDRAQEQGRPAASTPVQQQQQLAASTGGEDGQPVALPEGSSMVDAGPLTPLHRRVWENSTLLEELLLPPPSPHQVQSTHSCTTCDEPCKASSASAAIAVVGAAQEIAAPATSLASNAAASPSIHATASTDTVPAVRVPPPDVFADAARARKKRSRGSGNEPSMTATSTATMMGAAEQESEGDVTASGRTSACLTLQWQLLVDTRERVGHQANSKGHAALLEMLARQKVSCQSVMLPAGDFMLNVQLTDGKDGREGGTEAERKDAQESTSLGNSTGNTRDAKGVVMHEANVTLSSPRVAQGTICNSSSLPAWLRDMPPDAQGAHSVSMCSGCESNVLAQLYSHIGPVVVERKTLADLEASVKGNRYHEQRQLLQASPFLHIVWLVEGEAGMWLSHRKRPRPATSSSSALQANKDGGGDGDGNDDAAEQTRRRVYSACASLALSERFTLVHTRHLQESVLFLKAMSEQYVLRLQTALTRGQAGSIDIMNAKVNTEAADRMPAWTHPFISLCPHSAVHAYAAPTEPCLRHVTALQKRLRAATALPRMLMSIRGCSAHLAQLLASKYGTLHHLWKLLVTGGREVCDGDADIQRLTLPQKKVFVLLTEFLLAQQYS